MKPILWAIDVGATVVSAIVAESGDDGLRILGGGETPMRGLCRGEFTHVGDVAECLVRVVRQTERSAGLRCKSLFYNFDDASMESCFPSGSKTLSGEGQIGREDVHEVAAMAERFVGRFEKTTVYAREIGFLIDGKDAVVNPIGIYGRQLDVDVHVLLARARHMENWRRAIERARLGRGTAVLSLLSSAVGVLSSEELKGRRIVWDLGEDVLSGGVFERGGLREYAGRASDLGDRETAQWIGSATEAFMNKNVGIEETVITGDLAINALLVKALEERSSWKIRFAAPSLKGLEEPRRAALAGLLQLAAETPKTRSTRAQQDIVSGLKRKTEELIKEYF